MRPDVLLFFAACGFVAGTIAGGIGIPPAGVALALIATIPILFILKLLLSVILTIGLLFSAGNIYYAVDEYAYQRALGAAEKITSFEGRVLNDPRHRSGMQIAKVRIT